MATELFFSILWMSLALTGNFMSLKSSFLVISLSAFVNFLDYAPLDVTISVNTI